MLLAYVESCSDLHALTPAQRYAVAQYFTLYLLRCTDLTKAVARASAVLRPDQLHLSTVIRFKMSDVIRSHACNTKYKPALLRLAQGDRTGFRRLGVDPRRSLRTIADHATAIAKSVRRIQYSEIGPTHLAELEVEVLREVLPHAKWFAARKASFLTTVGGGDRDREDIVNDLQALALVAIRWYYPFRSGLHLANTVRQTITNRGQSIISYHTTKGRRRVQQLDDGSYLSMESHSATADRHSANVDTGSVDPRDELHYRQSLDGLASKLPQIAPVARFVACDDSQDAFVTFVGRRFDVDLRTYDDAVALLKRKGVKYETALARFLGEDEEDVTAALAILKRAIAA